MLFHSELLVTLTCYDRPRNYTETRHSYLKAAALLLENYYFHYLLLRIRLPVATSIIFTSDEL